MLRKFIFLRSIALLTSFISYGQLELLSTGTIYTIDFDNTVLGVNNGTFTGTGWLPNPIAGQLDSDAWELTGMSDGDLNFGGIGTSGDYARGSGVFNQSTAGWYAIDLGSGNMTLAVQPGGSDWTPGTLSLKVQNNTGITISEITVSYDLYSYNDHPRSNSLNFSHSSDNLNFIDENSLDYVSPEPADGNTYAISRSITLTGLSIPNGAYYYLKWAGNDISGFGSRDEFALDNISVSTPTSCIPTHIITNFSPTSGPANTLVTINGTGFTANSAVNISGTPTTIQSWSSTELNVLIPTGISNGIITVTENGCSQESSQVFTPLNSDNSGCQGSVSTSDLIISEVTDATSGSLSYIEIYNGTGLNINLNNYGIEVTFNGNSNNVSSRPLNGTLNNGDTYVIRTNVSTPCTVPNGMGELADQVTTITGLDTAKNDADCVSLYVNYIDSNNPGTKVDVWGNCSDKNWRENLGVAIGNEGFDFKRLTTASPLPSTIFALSDWNITDWQDNACTDDNYADVGVYSAGLPPAIINQPTYTSNCSISLSLSVTADEGYPGGNSLTYQWYEVSPNATTWSMLIDNGVYSGANSAILNILDATLLDGYQYYCQVGESGNTCYIASNSTMFNIPKTIWNGVSWDNGIPDISTIAIIDGNYNSGIGGVQTSFNSCNLIVNPGFTMNIANNTYVNVQNDVVNSGSIIVQSEGAFVQVEDSGSFIQKPGGSSQVNKLTANLNNWFEYTYWSSPVIGETVENAFPDTPSDRRFLFNAKNYLDQTKEIANNNSTAPGQDDIDDNGNDWQIATGTMLPGIGYVSTYSPFAPYPNVIGTATFDGAFNNGTINVPIFKNDLEANDTNWNLVGNPYPSAISADAFLSHNTLINQNVTIDPAINGVAAGAIFLWSQNSPPSNTNNGNEVLNFSQSDYAIINFGGIAVAGGDGVIPNGNIPSGQSFFISYDHNASGTPIGSGSTIKENYVTFNNAMRIADTNSNSQFFEAPPQKGVVNSLKQEINTLWLDLTTDNGVYSQLAVAYHPQATNKNDGMAYDTARNQSLDAYAAIYSSIENSELEYVIQCKSQTTLNPDEIIKLGFKTSISQTTTFTLSLAQIEGQYLSSNTIFLKDNYLNAIHDLKISKYSFTSDVGVFNDRFQIQFTNETLTSSENYNITPEIAITDLGGNRIKISSRDSNVIKRIEFHDTLGRNLDSIEVNDSSIIYESDRLHQKVLILTISLFSKKTIMKKLIIN